MLKRAAFVFILAHGIFLTVKTDYGFQRIEKSIEECFCIYEGAGTLVKAEVGGKTLKNMDRVRKGETVTFECIAFNSLSWQNGLRIFGNAKVACITCKRWMRKDNPDCNLAEIGNPFIILDEKIKLLPSGAAETEVGKTINLTCSSTFGYPQWYFRGKPIANENRYIPEFFDAQLFSISLDLTVIGSENGGVYECIVRNNLTYLDGRTVLDLQVKGENPFYTTTEQEVISTTTDSDLSPAIYEGIGLFWPKNVAVLENGNLRIRKGQKAYFKCVAIGGAEFPEWNVPDASGVSYKRLTRDYKNGIHYITYLTIRNADYNHEGMYECFIKDGPKSTTQVIVVGIRCEKLKDTGLLAIQYTNHQEVGSMAVFHCFASGVHIGVHTTTCLENGLWADPTPSCTDECKVLEETDLLKIHYTDNRKINSNAIFHCLAPGRRSGVSLTRCLPNGSWSDPTPTCTISSCRGDDLLSSLPENAEPAMFIVKTKSFPYKSKVKLTCTDGIAEGYPVANCGKDGKWNFDKVECISGCQVPRKPPDSMLILSPEKKEYKYGERVIFSCPPGMNLDSDFQVIMCLNNGWSDTAIPNCIEQEIKETLKDLKTG